MNLLYEHAKDTHDGVILNIMEGLRTQELKEAAIAYFVLLGRRLTEKEVDSECEKFLLEIQPEETRALVDFEITDALDKLVKLKLVERDSNGYYKAINPEEATERLDDRWRSSFKDFSSFF